MATKRRRRTSAKQKAAARKNIKKAQAAIRKRFGKRRKPTKARKARRRPGKRKAYGRRRRNTGGRRRNPRALSGLTRKSYAKGLTDLPRSLPKMLRGKGMVKNVIFAGGGMVAGMVGGSFLQRWTLPLIEKLPVIGGQLSGGMIQRVLGATFSYTAAWGIGHIALRKESDRTAFIVGGATGAIIEAIFPGRLGAQLARIPVVGPFIGYSSPVMGLAAYYGSNELAAYVEAPAYQGVGAYVSSPAYQGVGSYVEAPAYQGVGEYVEAPGYQSSSAAGDSVLSGLGVEMAYGRNELAGIGSNMASFLDEPVL